MAIYGLQVRDQCFMCSAMYIHIVALLFAVVSRPGAVWLGLQSSCFQVCSQITWLVGRISDVLTGFRAVLLCSQYNDTCHECLLGICTLLQCCLVSSVAGPGRCASVCPLMGVQWAELQPASRAVAVAVAFPGLGCRQHSLSGVRKLQVQHVLCVTNAGYMYQPGNTMCVSICELCTVWQGDFSFDCFGSIRLWHSLQCLQSPVGDDLTCVHSTCAVIKSAVLVQGGLRPGLLVVSLTVV